MHLVKCAFHLIGSSTTSQPIDFSLRSEGSLSIKAMTKTNDMYCYLLIQHGQWELTISVLLIRGFPAMLFLRNK